MTPKIKIQITKATMLLVLLQFAFAGMALAQRSALFSYKQNAVLTERQQHFANAWINEEWVSSYQIVYINTEVFNDNYLFINLPNNINVTTEKHQLNQHANMSFSWKGVITDPPGNADFVVNKDMVTARISSLSFTYLVYPLTDGYHVLLTCNTAQMPQDESGEGYEHMLQNAIEGERQESAKHVDSETQGQAELAGDCKVRILVVYTDDAALNLADPISFCQSCIDATNTAHTNSSVYFQTEMALAVELTYAEALNSTTDKTRLHDDGDGFLDEVHDLRPVFDADMCIMITENLQSGICGEAWTVANSTYSQPFCVVKRTCAVGNLSFPHELAHLYGCRHDPYVDNTNTPYAYGHGYVRLASQWRTVMAYNDYCSDNGSSCTRIQWFSNPAVNYSGNATGVSGTNDNESALEASVPNISSLEPMVINKIIATNQSFSADEYADIIGSTSLTNNTGVTFNYLSGSVGSWRAGSYIDLKPGFRAYSGSDFIAFLDECTNLRPDNDESIEMPLREFFSSPTGSVTAFPNPYISEFDVIVNIATKGQVEIQLYNLIGKKVLDLTTQTLPESGSYKFTFETPDLSPGLYLLVVNSPDGIKTARLTKGK